MRLLAPLLVAALVACGGATAPSGGSPDATTDVTTTDGSSTIDGGVPSDTFACGGAGECDIRPKSCCGACGSPTPSDMIAVNWQKLSVYDAKVCGNTACPDCASKPEPNLAPVCRAKSCVAVDVRTDVALSGCKTDQDCGLRSAGCCEPCGSVDPSELIAVSSTGRGEYVANQCHPDAGGCPKCAVQYPAGYAARCNPTTLHCEVVMPLADAGGG